LSLFLDDLVEALSHADLVLKMAREAGNVRWELPALIAKANILHKLGREREADSHLVGALEIARKIRSRFWEFVPTLGQTYFSFRRGNDGKALQQLRRAMALGREGGYFYAHVFQPEGLSLLCEKALAAGIEPEYAREMIRRLKLLPPESSPPSEKWPWRVKIKTLGQFGVWVDEKPIRFSRKGQQKPLALLKILTALGGKGIKSEQVSDLLWPEADGDDAYHSLLTNLHRLRKLIDHENAVQFSDGRLTLDDKACWVDAWAFERHLEEAENERKKGVPGKAVQYIEKAASLYKGPFLSGEIDEPWLISPRERLKSKFVRSLIWLGSHWQRSKEWEKAIESYLRGLEIDDLAEELYRELMACYQCLGRRAEALSIYQRCRKTLSATLGIEPSPHTEEIYRSIMVNVKR
jgi:DNA-binding SARP family transcriptional activator